MPTAFEQLLMQNALQNKTRINPLPGDVEPMGNQVIARQIAESPQPEQPEITPPEVTSKISPQELFLNQMAQEQRRKEALIQPLIKQQQQDVEAKRGALKSYLESTTPKLDLSPLAALVDSSTGSKFAGSYQAPQGVNELSDRVQKAQAGISDAQKGLTETQTKAANDSAMSKYLLGQQRLQHQDAQLDDKFAFRAHKGVVDALNNNKALANELGQLRTLDNAYSGIINAQSVSPQQVDEFQQAVVKSLSITGTSGVHEREKRLFDNLNMELARKAQYWGGDISKIPKDDPVIQHIKDLAQIMAKNTQEQLKDQIDTLTEGYGSSVYQTHPKLKADLDRKIEAIYKQSQTRALNQNEGGTTKAPQKTARQLEIEQLKRELGE